MSPSDTNCSIAIIGGGCSGLLAAVHLFNNGFRGRVTVIEPRKRLGAGLAYSTTFIQHLLNVPAGKMSAFPKRPAHFLDWLRDNHWPDAKLDSLAPRKLYGEYLQEVLKHVDLFFPNEREAKKIARTENLSQAVSFLAGLSKVVIVKCGSRSSICRAGDQQWTLAPPKVEMVDDVGAGDTFDAGFVHQYLRGSNLEDCLAFANLAAAYSVTQSGGTEAFRNHSLLFSFLRQQWMAMGRGSFPG